MLGISGILVVATQRVFLVPASSLLETNVLQEICFSRVFKAGGSAQGLHEKR